MSIIYYLTKDIKEL